MKIQPTKNTQNFSCNWREFCYDDETSKQRRKYIREHLEEQFENDEIKSSGRLSEYELNQLIKSLVLAKPELKRSTEQNPEIDEELLESAEFQNLQSLYDKNSYRAGLNDITPKQIEIAKQAGIRHIVDLREYNNNDQYGDISYYPFPIFSLLNRNCVKKREDEFVQEELEYEEAMLVRSMTSEEINDTKESLRFFYSKDKEDFCKNFVGFIQTMQKGNVLIGCEYGTINTDFALCLNVLFNPKADISALGFNRFKYRGYKIVNIYNNLSDEDKKAMGWDEEFDKNFLKRLEGYGFWID